VTAPQLLEHASNDRASRTQIRERHRPFKRKRAVEVKPPAWLRLGRPDPTARRPAMRQPNDRGLLDHPDRP
jgi:hypothetical protein